jgi:hypothetical protein
MQTLDAMRREIASHIHVIASAAKQSIAPRKRREWNASLRSQ